ncbi:MAG TPA: twin-arginine translocase TatA/TatE family subunit [Acidiphilium sp.]|jgi:sec-independent protein translocase protein TatB|uniref:Sec-independent protein translocase subunit TatA/TatB n=1 Tax=unclassified Acidiphilium TaxID=2617493 RepID=UPI000BCE1585|nr:MULTISPECIES: twin-arginine translocase TatA/TatE family subunit [unclassified Acidiphilium]OYV57539.1 MAG: Sec-independent protein translocase TatB [Acidiphilium sp. 20-67-58]HQT59582.1 twin-arginine translocase TatA/TatE family subunit [Acidiphilium sp.]HQU10339.1 twin-arginine translocase TatA/TatE family subunit [Acidiphilium sp.]
MLGFSWPEIGVILMVALVVIGPKDLPVAIRTATAGLRKMRGLASEFQGHVQELMREADLADIGNDLRNLRNFDLGSTIERHVDPDGTIRSSFDPMDGDSFAVPSAADAAIEGAADDELPPDMPAFVPPDAVRARPVPAFIPPGTRLW